MNKNQTDDPLSEKVKKTKREIEELRTNLEGILSKNIRTDLRPHHLPENNVQVEIAQPTDNQLKANVTVRSKSPSKTTQQSEQTVQTGAIKRTKPYDVEKTREYMQKQREQRANQIKKENTQNFDLALKKQRLKELQVKQREIVLKNVQKRERSKSGSRNEPVRLDTARHSSQERVVAQCPRAAARNRSKFREPPSKTATVSIEKNPQPRGRLRWREKTVEPSVKIIVTDEPPIVIVDECSPTKDLSITSENVQAIPRFMEVEVNRTDQAKPSVVIPKEIEMGTKETQTVNEKVKIEPTWLHDEAVKPYPYNFINTVKRKLQIAVNSPTNYINVGVQSSLRTPEADANKSKAEIKELLVQSISKSTKKPPTLDLRSVEHMELKLANKSNSHVSKNLLTEYSTDSDTSKNIPDISSESVTTSKNATTTTSKRLNLDGLNELKLKRSRSNSSSAQNSTEKTDTNGYPDVNLANSYSSDFQNDSTSTIITEKSQRTPQTISNVLNSDSKSQISLSKNVSTHTNNYLPESVTDRSVGRDMSLTEPPLNLIVSLNQANLPQKTLNNSVQTINNQIHSKFEAEVSLLNDFNESLKQFTSVEKAFQNLKNQNEKNIANKIFHNVDTQTSFLTKTMSTTRDSINKSIVSSTINFSRGSDIMDEFDLMNNKSNSSFSLSGFELNNLQNSTINSTIQLEESKLNHSLGANIENMNSCVGLSLNMFDQLIRDEDIRLEQLRQIIKIREQALLDRTKSELLWLDIKKKQFVQTGKIEEASLLKKKQRAIVLKQEQERNEIKKLKQLQKSASEERKNILKQQRNLIKNQLSTNTMLTTTASSSKIKMVKTPRERRNSGPLRVVQQQSCNESSTTIRSEASFSRHETSISQQEDDVLSVSTKSLSYHVSEASDFEITARSEETKLPVKNVKRTLLMREVALQKRRKAAEDLLQWHQKLLDEEKKIAELEAAAEAVFKPQIPNKISLKTKQQTDCKPKLSEKHRFTGKQLNQLWKNIRGTDDGQFVDDKIYKMSQITLERFCKSASQPPVQQQQQQEFRTVTTPTLIVKKNESNNSVSEEISEDVTTTTDNSSAATILTDNNNKLNEKSDENTYSTFFESESFDEKDDDEDENKSQMISELINNFNKIGDEISLLSKNSEKTISENVDEESRSSDKIEQSDIVNLINAEENRKEDNATELDKSASQIEDEDDFASKLSNLSDKEVKSSIIEEKDECELSSEDVSSVSIHEVESNLGKSNDSETISQLKSIEIDNGEVVEDNKSVESTLTSINQVETNENRAKEIEEKSDSDTTTKYESQDEEEEEEEKISNDANRISEKDVEEESLKSASESGGISDASTIPEEETITKSKTISVANLTKSDHITDEVLSLEEAIEAASKIEESLLKLNNQLSNDNQSTESTSASLSLVESESKTVEDAKSVAKSTSSVSEEINVKSTSSASPIKSLSESSNEKTPPPRKNPIDVMKRVSEILDASTTTLNRGDKSPRLQDLYVTTYDVLSASDLNDEKQRGSNIFGNEAEELLKKQLAIEQEIKQLEQQQKEQLPYGFVREIPNKPPPPYTLPANLSSTLSPTILPTDPKEINELTNYSSKVIYKAYQNKNLDKVKYSENSFKLCSKISLAKQCGEFMFNICKDLAKEHYKQFEVIDEPIWLKLDKPAQLAIRKPYDVNGLEKYMNRKLKELFGFIKVHVTESANVKWGRKKRDHVDEILVIESQQEESQWTNFDKDELIVKDVITKDIMKMLLDEVADEFSKIISKKNSLLG